jgi:mercuric ion transport protein
MSNPKTLLKIGVSGSVVAALCCFTPVSLVAPGLTQKKPSGLMS